jgi:hypothetical protein
MVPERHARCHGVAAVVPCHAAPCGRSGPTHAGCRSRATFIQELQLLFDDTACSPAQVPFP